MPEKNDIQQEALHRKKFELIQIMKSKDTLHSFPLEQAFLKVPRENFILPQFQLRAYEDEALPILASQTISQPSTIASMLEILDVKKGMKVLEVGSGSGYVLALLAELVGEDGKIFGTEMVKELIEFSEENLKNLEYKNIYIFRSDGSEGLKDYSPYDRILVSAACPFIPKPLFDQLQERGKIVAPVGDPNMQTLQMMEKINGKLLKKDIFPHSYQFVPLKGKYGWKSIEK